LLLEIEVIYLELYQLLIKLKKKATTKYPTAYNYPNLNALMFLPSLTVNTMAATLNSKKTDSKPFNFDLERMKQAIEAPTRRVPNNLDFKGFEEWMKSRKKKD